MKLQLDTEKKTITIEEDVNLNDLFNTIESLLPAGEWEHYTLKRETINNWFNPTPYDPFDLQPYSDGRPFWKVQNPPNITYGIETGDVEVKTFTHNFEINGIGLHFNEQK